MVQVSVVPSCGHRWYRVCLWYISRRSSQSNLQFDGTNKILHSWPSSLLLSCFFRWTSDERQQPRQHRSWFHHCCMLSAFNGERMFRFVTVFLAVFKILTSDTDVPFTVQLLSDTAVWNRPRSLTGSWVYILFTPNCIFLHPQRETGILFPFIVTSDLWTTYQCAWKSRLKGLLWPTLLLIPLT